MTEYLPEIGRYTFRWCKSNFHRFPWDVLVMGILIYFTDCCCSGCSVESVPQCAVICICKWGSEFLLDSCFQTCNLNSQLIPMYQFTPRPVHPFHFFYERKLGKLHSKNKYIYIFFSMKILLNYYFQEIYSLKLKFILKGKFTPVWEML